MRENILLQKLRADEVVLGLCNKYPSAGIVEGMCPGWDFLWIDGQHGEMDHRACMAAVRTAASVGVESLLRVPGHEAGVLGMYADMSPSGILVPMVNTPEDASRVVDRLRFPPLGNRSYGGRRVIDLDGRNFYRERELAVFAQIETVEALENVHSIAATEGIDVLFFGPDDMKCQMGIPVNTGVLENDRLRSALERTATAAREAGKPCAGVAPSETTLRAFIDMGYRCLCCGSDSGFLSAGSQERRALMRDIVAEEVGASAE
jgi:4-hydroxy-2-oxoheptanedioate aldolase